MMDLVTPYIGPKLLASNFEIESGNGTARLNLLSPVGAWAYGSPMNASTAVGNPWSSTVPTTNPCGSLTSGEEVGTKFHAE